MEEETPPSPPASEDDYFHNKYGFYGLEMHDGLAPGDGEDGVDDDQNDGVGDLPAPPPPDVPNPPPSPVPSPPPPTPTPPPPTPTPAPPAEEECPESTTAALGGLFANFTTACAIPAVDDPGVCDKIQENYYAHPECEDLMNSVVEIELDSLACVAYLLTLNETEAEVVTLLTECFADEEGENEGSEDSSQRWEGVAYDPYLVSCRVFVDTFPPVELDDITDAYGVFKINGLASGEITQGKLKVQPAAQGAATQLPEGSSICHDSITRLRFTVPLEAPLAAKVVSPLTTLVSHTETTADAQDIVRYALGMDGQVDLLTYNTVAELYKNAAGASNVLKQTAQILNIVNQGQSLFDGTSIAEEMFKSVAKQMSSHYDARSAGRRRGLLQAGTFDLTSSSFVSDLFKDAATSVGSTVSAEVIDAVSDSVASLNNVIKETEGASGAGILKEMAKVDIVLQTDVKDQVSKLVAGTIDTEVFKASTTTEVVKNKVAETVVPVDVSKYLASALDDGGDDNKGLSLEIIIIGGACILFLVGALIGVYYMQKKGKKGQAIYNQQQYYGSGGQALPAHLYKGKQSIGERLHLEEDDTVTTKYNPAFGKDLGDDEGGDEEEGGGLFNLLDQFGLSSMMMAGSDDEEA